MCGRGAGIALIEASLGPAELVADDIVETENGDALIDKLVMQ